MSRSLWHMGRVTQAPPQRPGPPLAQNFKKGQEITFEVDEDLHVKATPEAV